MRPGLLFLARAGIARRPFRGAVLVAGFAVLTVLMTQSALVDRQSRAAVDRGRLRLGADLVAVPRGLDEDMTRAYRSGQAPVFYMDAALEQKIAAFPFVARTSAQVFLRSLPAGACCSAHNVTLVGFDPESDFTVRPWLADHPDRVLAADQVLTGAGFAVAAGDTLRFFGRTFRVAGRLDPTGLGLDAAVFLPMAAVRSLATPAPGKLAPLDLPPGRVSAVLIKLRPERDRGLAAYRAAYELETALPEISVLQPEDLLVKTRHNLDLASAALHANTYVVWPLATLIAGLVFALAANERTRAIGLLRAMGARRSFVFGLILTEALTLAALGAAVGLAAAAAALVLAPRLGISVLPAAPDAATLAVIFFRAVALALAAGAAAALYPAWRAARLEPYEALRSAE